jgi:SAM-dependent methyltransferase
LDPAAGHRLELRCGRCALSFPVIGGELPVLTTDPARHLAEEAIRLRRDLGWFRDRSTQLESGLRRFPARSEHTRALQDGFDRTIRLLTRVLAPVRELLDQTALLDAAAAAPRETSGYGARKLTTLLRRDFGGEPEAEAEVFALREALLSTLGVRPSSLGPILVLGAGIGRLAAEIGCAGGDVSAIDLSVPLMAAGHLLRGGDMEASDIHTRNARTTAEQAFRFTARTPAHLRDLDGRLPVRYAVADATCAPFKDREFSSILSVYFTDVVPLSRLLPEIWRLLEVGGTFAHVGPLGYHFDDLNEHLSAEAFMEQFRAAGFEVSAPRWLTTTHYAARESLFHAHFDNMAFTARKSGAVLQREHPRPPFIR